MKRFFRNASVVLACFLAFAVPVFAVETDSDEWPDFSMVPVEEPVTVETVSDDREITVNVYVRPPSVQVPVEIPLEVPVNIPVEIPVSFPAAESPVDLLSTDTEEPVFPAFPPYSILSLDVPHTGNTPGDTIRAVLESLFGTYTPRTQTVIQRLEDGTSVEYQEYVPGLAGIDWTWIASVVLFSLMLYCLFRLLGGVLNRV